MMKTKILSIETANPPLCMSQAQVWDSIRTNLNLSPRAVKLYQQFLLDEGIRRRYFGIDKIETIYKENYDQATVRFCQVGTDISVQAAWRSLERVGVSSNQIDALIVATCTGYLCPGLSSYIAEKLKLREDVFTQDLVGHGCGAALPALRAGQHFLSGNAGGHVLVICTEICSASVYIDEEPDLILSNAIFGDGSAACLLSHDDSRTGLTLTDFRSILLPAHRDRLRFTTKDARLKNSIDKKVPQIVADMVRKLCTQFGLERMRQTRYFAIHPGGRAILDRIGDALSLDEKDLFASRKILREYGNMSSPSVLYVLKSIIDSGSMYPGDETLMLSFGAGLTGHGFRAKWE